MKTVSPKNLNLGDVILVPFQGVEEQAKVIRYQMVIARNGQKLVRVKVLFLTGVHAGSDRDFQIDASEMVKKVASKTSRLKKAAAKTIRQAMMSILDLYGKELLLAVQRGVRSNKATRTQDRLEGVHHKYGVGYEYDFRYVPWSMPDENILVTVALYWKDDTITTVGAMEVNSSPAYLIVPFSWSNITATEVAKAGAKIADMINNKIAEMAELDDN
jgi:hypothetical protein